MLTIRMAVNFATQSAVVQALTRPLRRRRSSAASAVPEFQGTYPASLFFWSKLEVVAPLWWVVA